MPSYNILNHYIGNNGFIHLRHVQSSDSFKSLLTILYHILPLMYHVHSQLKIIISIIDSPEMFLSFYSLYYCSYLAIAAIKGFCPLIYFSSLLCLTLVSHSLSSGYIFVLWHTHIKTCLSELVLNIWKASPEANLENENSSVLTIDRLYTWMGSINTCVVNVYGIQIIEG